MCKLKFNSMETVDIPLVHQKWLKHKKGTASDTWDGYCLRILVGTKVPHLL